MNRLGEMSGLSQQTISYIERGMRDPTVDSLLRICEALEVEASELILEAEIKAEMKSIR
jgi:transcriptional regulator with XRE-family HTH domain